MTRYTDSHGTAAVLGITILPGQHFLTWPTAETAVCKADMVGQRNSRRDLDPSLTTCPRCLEWIEANPDYFEAK